MKLRTVLGAMSGYSSMTILFPDSISIVTIGRGTSFPAASGSLLPCACTRPYCVCQIAAKSAPATSITTNREMRRTRDRLLDHVAHAVPWGAPSLSSGTMGVPLVAYRGATPFANWQERSIRARQAKGGGTSVSHGPPQNRQAPFQGSGRKLPAFGVRHRRHS